MITPELLARINELARKKRTVGLTAEELAEQKELYKIYLAEIRGQVTNLLESIEFVDVEEKNEQGWIYRRRCACRVDYSRD